MRPQILQEKQLKSLQLETPDYQLAWCAFSFLVNLVVNREDGSEKLYSNGEDVNSDVGCDKSNSRKVKL